MSKLLIAATAIISTTVLSGCGHTDVRPIHQPIEMVDNRPAHYQKLIDMAINKPSDDELRVFYHMAPVVRTVRPEPVYLPVPSRRHDRDWSHPIPAEHHRSHYDHYKDEVPPNHSRSRHPRYADKIPPAHSRSRLIRYEENQRSIRRYDRYERHDDNRDHSNASRTQTPVIRINNHRPEPETRTITKEMLRDGHDRGIPAKQKTHETGYKGLAERNHRDTKQHHEQKQASRNHHRKLPQKAVKRYSSERNHSQNRPAEYKIIRTEYKPKPDSENEKNKHRFDRQDRHPIGHVEGERDKDKHEKAEMKERPYSEHSDGKESIRKHAKEKNRH